MPEPATVCFVGSAEYPETTEDDRLTVPELRAAGMEVDFVPWDRPGVDWAGYDGVVVRTPWDYYLRIAEFMAWIDARAGDGTHLWNPPEVLSWNADKRYLEELREAGVRVVPTEWLPAGGAGDLTALLRDRGWDRAVVKPQVSAGGHRTFSVSADGEAPRPEVLELVGEADVMVQPFLEEIETEGEWSLVFFGREYSHSVVKRAAGGEFRVQARHGGAILEARAGGELIRQAASVLDHVDGDLLYARVDGVVRDDGFTLIELEVLEPALFFAQDAASPRRFADALRERLRPPGGARPSSSRASR